MDDDSLSDSLNDEDLKNVSLGSDDEDSGDEASKKYAVGKIDYKAQKPTQVTFTKGARILVLGAPEGGWFRGRLESSYEEGLFPLAYTMDEADALAASGDGKKKDEEEIVMVCKCLQDYVAKTATELSFKAHDRVEVLSNSDPKLWKCRFKGKVGTVAPAMLEEDKGFTIRKAAASKQASREKFQNRRVKEQGVIETKKTGSSGDISALKKEQEKLALERDKLQKDKEAKKEARARRESGSFNDRLKQRTDQKKGEAAAKEQQVKKVEKVNSAVAAWAGSE